MSVPSPSSINPIVGGVNVLSSSEYITFASEREAQLANFQTSPLSNIESTQESSSSSSTSPSYFQYGKGFNGLKPVPAVLRNFVTHYSPFYTKSYYNEKNDDVYAPYGGIPAPPSKDYTYFKTVITPDDQIKYLYKNDKNGDIKGFIPKKITDQKQCSTIFNPVCGTDGITYRNTCLLDQQTQNTNGQVKFKHPGYCPDSFLNEKQFVNYKGEGYNVVESSVVDRNGKRYVYVLDDNLNASIKLI